MNEWNDISLTKEENKQLEENSKINETVVIGDINTTNNILVDMMKQYEVDLNDSEVCRVIEAWNQIPNS